MRRPFVLCPVCSPGAAPAAEAVPAPPGSGLGALGDPKGMVVCALGTEQARVGGFLLAGDEGDFLQHNGPGSRDVGGCSRAGQGLGGRSAPPFPPGQAEPPTRPGQAESGPRGVKRSPQATSGGRGVSLSSLIGGGVGGEVGDAPRQGEGGRGKKSPAGNEVI